MEKTDYAFRTVVDLPYEEALRLIKEGLNREGFGVLTEVDVKKVLGEKLDVQFRQYSIIGACNPPLSHRAFTKDIDAGLVLPCNVTVYEDDDRSVVTIADPVVMIAVLRNPNLDEVAREAREKLKRVIKRLEGESPA